MARLAALFTIGLRLASVGGIADECDGGRACGAAEDDETSLLMLHKATELSGDVDKSGEEHEWPKAGASRGGLKMNRGGEMRSTAFKGASLLCMKFALPRSLSQEASKGGLFGEAKQGGFTVHEGEHVLVTVAHFPEAPMGWTGAPGSSDPKNLPHSLFSVQVPLKDGAQSLSQTSYALTDDDTAMNVYRMGENIPAKMATFTMAGGKTPTEATGIRLDRRGVNIFELKDISAGGKSVGKHEVDEFFQKPTREWPTGSLPGNFPLFYMRRTVKPSSIRSVTKVNIGKVSVTSHTDERLDALLGSKATLVSAYRVEADLDISSQIESVAETSGTLKVAKHAKLADTWRREGRQTTTLKRDINNKLAYQNGDICWANFKMKREGLAPYLPPGVTLDRGDALVWLTRWQPADFANPWQMKGKVGTLYEYNELWVEVPVVIEGKKYMYPLTLLLDEDVGTIGGRDAGFPKKMADITYDYKARENSGVTIDISRNGKKVFKMTGKFGAQARRETPITGLSDNAKNAPPMAFITVTSYSHDPKLWRPSWLIWKSSNKVQVQHPLKDVKVEFGDDDTAPLGRWFEGEATAAGFVRMDQDWTAPFGGVQGKPLAFEGYQTWWNKNYQLLYM